MLFFFRLYDEYPNFRSLSYIIPKKPGMRKPESLGEKEAKEFERRIESNYTVGIYGYPCDFRQKSIRQI